MGFKHDNNLSNHTSMAEGDVSSSKMVSIVKLGVGNSPVALYFSRFNFRKACFVILFLKSMNCLLESLNNGTVFFFFLIYFLRW